MEENILKLDLEKVSAQEVFDYVVNHLAKQKAPALSSKHNGKTCIYYDEENNRACAAGSLLTDYGKEVIKDKGYNHLSWERLVAKLKLPSSYRPLITDLQIAHDSVLKFGSSNNSAHLMWPAGLSQVATKYNLMFDKEKFIEQLKS